MLKKYTLVVTLLLALNQTVLGAGFALYEYSARGTAMGGAVMANKAEAASLASNPALITQLEGTQAQLGISIVSAEATTAVMGQARSLKKDIWYLPNFYLTHKLNENISLGLGGFSRFGLGGEYKNHQDWVGSRLAYKVKLETFSFTPTIAVKANDELSLAMGLEAMLIGFTQDSQLVQNVPSSWYQLDGSGISWGGNFSFAYRPQWAEKWSLGGMYRTKIKQTLDGRLHTGGFAYLANYDLYDADAKGSITLPDSLSFGLAFNATEKLTMELGVVGTLWSTYDQILIEYKDDESAPAIHNKKNYKDTLRVSLGAEYLLTDRWALRAGYVYDQSPINEHNMDTLVPADDRHIASAGVGYTFKNWTVDAAYAHVFARSLRGYSNAQSGTLPMRYSGAKSDMYALTVGYKF